MGTFFTLSRGSLVVVPVAILLLLAGLPRTRWLPSLMLLVSALAVPVVAGMRPIGSAATADNWGMVLVWTVVAVGAGVAATWAVGLLTRLPSRILWISFSALFALALVGLSVLLVTRPLEQVLPKSMARLLEISTETKNAQGRVEFTRDALRAFQAQPWGYGGHGWERAYRQVQQVHYVATETHNHYAQTLVEAGALGLLSLVAALLLALWTAFRNRGEESAGWSMAVAGSFLAIHAFLDVDLSYFYLWLLMWVLLAANQPATAVPAKQEKRWISPVTIGMTVMVALLSLDLAAAAIAFKRVEAAPSEMTPRRLWPRGGLPFSSIPGTASICGHWSGAGPTWSERPRLTPTTP